MNAAEKALHQKIADFQLDDPTSQFSFSDKLAKENGWSKPYAQRVVDEYKRFLFLAMTAGHVVTPSDQVDQAWHLHLTYTESYWQDLCDNVLGRPIHHGPSKGGDTVGRTPPRAGIDQQSLVSVPRAVLELPIGPWLEHVVVPLARVAARLLELLGEEHLLPVGAQCDHAVHRHTALELAHGGFEFLLRRFLCRRVFGGLDGLLLFEEFALELEGALDALTR